GALGAVAAILGTAARLDTEESAALDITNIVVRSVDLGGAEDELGQRLLVDRLEFLESFHGRWYNVSRRARRGSNLPYAPPHGKRTVHEGVRTIGNCSPPFDSLESGHGQTEAGNGRSGRARGAGAGSDSRRSFSAPGDHGRRPAPAAAGVSGS